MSTENLKLYSYWRSSAAYRVRIALNLKQLDYETIPVHLLREGGEQHAQTFQAVNPQQLIPVLIDGDRVVRQSLAIIEYLEESFEGARLLPVTSRERARARGLAYTVACDVHPINNLRVLQYLENEFNVPQVERERWVRHWIELEFKSIEEMLSNNPSTGLCSEGDTPSIADLCLIPQVYNAKRFGVDMSAYPTITRVSVHCNSLDAFIRAQPESQPDALG